MRIQKTFLALLFTACCGQGFGDTGSPQDVAPRENCQPCQSQSYEIQPTIEFKTGYFFFADDKMRKVYHEGGLDLQIAGSYPLWRWLQIYGSVEYIEKHGRSLHGHEKAKIREYPISLGLKPQLLLY